MASVLCTGGNLVGAAQIRGSNVASEEIFPVNGVRRAISEYPGAMCSAFEECAHLAGDCCPTADGTYLGCCKMGTCEREPACRELGLEGDCCPTLDGTDLDCCGKTAAPTPSPTTASPTDPPVPPTTASPVTHPPKCMDNPVCGGLGLVGECCPTQDGVFLDCCDPAPQCAHNPACNALGLAGDCCPTIDGVFLACCAEEDPATKQCDGNWACNGLSGDCCPTVDGVHLDCCSE
eukprot:CAMPEP_0172453486 /NCGR_PEP_ID=MMETSP1065-20121228/10779_1 /TAXON_ID=265537 /ORGANISM="Amphiprora paludosa, Strain CCMP125" /LENGTH=233 /DNA_ID=CAMNT_0013205669 /DNA_START=121 /DNA_END=822 /DNA_ORIENTATION=+